MPHAYACAEAPSSTGVVQIQILGTSFTFDYARGFHAESEVEEIRKVEYINRDAERSIMQHPDVPHHAINVHGRPWGFLPYKPLAPSLIVVHVAALVWHPPIPPGFCATFPRTGLAKLVDRVTSID